MTDKLAKLNKLMQSRKKSYVEKTPEDVYRQVAGNFEHFEPEDIAQMGGVESQHGKYTKPLRGGSARGLFQFQPETAEYLIPGSSKTLMDPNTQAELMTKYLEKNKAKSPEDAYVMHNLGPTRGKAFLNANDDQPISNVIPSHVIRANPGLYKVKTVGQARENIKNKLIAGGESIEITPDLLDLLKERE
jgi:hypothetical protein